MKTMKMNKYFSMAALGALALTFGSCENGTPEFDDYEGGTSVYSCPPKRGACIGVGQ